VLCGIEDGLLRDFLCLAVFALFFLIFVRLISLGLLVLHVGVVGI
jgi:hypothetical protein